MSRRTTDERRRLLLLVLVGVAVVALPGRLAWSMRSSALDEADAVREQARGVRERVILGQRNETNRAKLVHQLEVLGRAMPAEADLPSVLDALAQLAAASGVVWQGSTQTPPATREAARPTGSEAPTTVRTTVPEVEPSATTTPTGASPGTATTVAEAGPVPVTGSFTIDVDVAGTTEALTSYLDQVRGLTRLITVERLALTWNSQTDARLPVTAHLTLKAYTWAGAPRGDTPTGAQGTASS